MSLIPVKIPDVSRTHEKGTLIRLQSRQAVEKGSRRDLLTAKAREVVRFCFRLLFRSLLTQILFCLRQPESSVTGNAVLQPLSKPFEQHLFGFTTLRTQGNFIEIPVGDLPHLLER